MGFSKSKSVGPFRLNLSKSGLGVSTGVKGARVSFGPRGTYVNLGRNGIYYRKKIGGGKTKRNSNRVNSNNAGVVQPQYNNIPYEPDYSTDAIRVSDSASNSALGREIISDINKSRLFFWLWLIISFVLIYFIKEWGLILMFVSAIPLWRFFSARLGFDLDSEAELEWKKLTEIIYGMRNSKKLWLVETASYNSNTKVNAGAFRNISRGDATVKIIKANRSTGFRVKSDVPSALIKSNKCKILFIPSGILIKKGARLIAYSYEDISLFSSTTNFIENGPVARDAEIIRHTWQFVNKNGTPDRRYKNNRQLPVCLYGTLMIRGNNLDVELQTSNKSVTRNVDSAYQHYTGYVKRLGNSSYRPVQQKTTNTVPSGGTFISYEERKLLNEMNDTIRELGGEGYVDVLKEELACDVSFVDGQLYQKHALLLYRASNSVYDRLDSVEYNLNANTPYKNEVVPVNEREFLIHLYMDNLDGFGKELPLSAKLKTALDSSKIWRPVKKQDERILVDDHMPDDINSVLSSGASLFSGDFDNSGIEDDPYSDLFETEENESEKKDEDSNQTPDVVDDLMGFFNEDE